MKTHFDWDSLFVEVDAVVVLTTSVTATTFVLPVLADTATTVTHMALHE